MIDFEINNLTGYRLPRRAIAKTVAVFASQAKLKQKLNLSLAFIPPAQIRKWNMTYRGRDQVTDVLSFTADGEGEFGDSLGEILICPKRAAKQAREYGWSLQQEIIRLLIHGLAHLAGYDHENISPPKAREMEIFEGRILEKMAKSS